MDAFKGAQDIHNGQVIVLYAKPATASGSTQQSFRSMVLNTIAIRKTVLDRIGVLVPDQRFGFTYSYHNISSLASLLKIQLHAHG